MARLAKEQWEEARAEYEVRGLSLREIAKNFGISEGAVRKCAKKQAWVQGKSTHLVERKVAAIKQISEIEKESTRLPRTFRHTIDSVVQERLQAEGLLASLDAAIAGKAIEMAAEAQSPDVLETLSRARKNLAPQMPRDASTTVNVNQQAAADIHVQPPREALAEIVEAAREDFQGGSDEGGA